MAGDTELAVIEGLTEARQFVVRDEGGFMRYLLSCDADAEGTSSGADSGGTLRLAGNATTEFKFKITEGPKDVEIDVYVSGNQSATLTLKTADGETKIQYPDPEKPGTGFGACLEPGEYVLETNWKPGSVVLDAPLAGAILAQLTVGEKPDFVPVPPGGRFTHPDIVTQRGGDDQLVIDTPQILSETALGNGLTEFEVIASVRNLSGAGWTGVTAALTETREGSPDIEIISQLPVFPVEPGETAAPPAGSMAVVRVADADAAALRASIADGSRFELSGTEQPVFLYPVRPLAPEDLRRVAGGQRAPTGLDLPYLPLIGSGTILLEWEPYFRVPFITNVVPKPIGVPGHPDIFVVQGIDLALPAMIKDIELSGPIFTVTLFEPREVSPSPAVNLDFTQVMIDGLATTEMPYEGHPDDIVVTEIPESRTNFQRLGLNGLFPAPMPLHFNDVSVGPGILVSGSFLFKPKTLDVLLEMDALSVKRLEVTAAFQADCNLLLETEEDADNSVEPIISREGSLLDLELLNLKLPFGFSFQPRLQIQAGALVSAPTSLSLPITTRMNVEIVAGVRDGVAYYDSEFTQIPLHVSDPGFFEALEGSATAYLDCEIKALIGFAGGLGLTGPTLGVRAEADFTLTPLGDPWWSTHAELSTFGGVELNLANVITLVDKEKTIQSWPIFDQDAGGPLFSGAARKSFNPQPGFRPLGNPRTRWIRSLRPDVAGTPPGGNSFAIQLEAGADLLTGAGAVIARLSPEGDLRWALDPTPAMAPAAAVAEPDGGFTILSSLNSRVRMARFTADGTLLWNRDHLPSGGVLWSKTTDFVRREGPGGKSEYFVLARAYGGEPLGFFITLIKLDEGGELVWSKIYAIPRINEPTTNTAPGAITLTSTGDLLVVGTTGADISENPVELANISNNGLIIKIDGDSGDVIWNTIIGSVYLPSYESVLETPDGSIFMGGNYLRHVFSDMPAMLLTRLDADGQVDESILIGSGPDTSGVPRGGETPFDTIRDMTWSDGNLWLCGHIGVFNGSGAGSIGYGASAFTAMVDDKLGVSRFVIHAGPASDFFNSIVATEDGLLVSGLSDSFHPWPNGASGEGQATPGSLITTMLPWEGRTRFHLASAGNPEGNVVGAEADRGSFFVTPRIRAVSQYSFNTLQLVSGGGNNLTSDFSGSVIINVTDVPMTRGDFAFAPAFIDPEEYKAIEFMPRSLITDESTYLDWYQVGQAEDDDGDGLTSAMEFFLGTEPGVADFDVIGFEYLPADNEGGNAMVRYTMPRSLLASGILPTVLSSPDLEAFAPHTDFSAGTAPRDAKRETLTLDIPAPDASRFYRLKF